MKTETDWAIRNLELAGLFDKDSDYDGMLGNAVKRLLETHQKEGHSGASHYRAIALFYKVAKGEALTLRFWQEKFEAYNKMAELNSCKPWTEESFEEIVMKKPKC